MSTRSQVCCVENGQPLYLYQHCDGYDTPKNVQGALLAGKIRWNSPSYLTRIIFSHMLISGRYEYDGKTVDPVEETIGYGISLTPCENQYNLLIVDHDRKLIGFMDSEAYNPELIVDSQWFTYPEYLELNENQLETAYGMHR